VACRYLVGRILTPDEFSGGEAPGQANFVLRKLGFTVVKKRDEEQEPQTGKDWSENEVRLTVADYFEMLEAELLGKSYKKSEHRRTLAPKLQAGQTAPAWPAIHRGLQAKGKLASAARRRGRELSRSAPWLFGEGSGSTDAQPCAGSATNLAQSR